MKIDDLRCEYLVNPVGIDVEKPRLGWKLTSNSRGDKQSAYQIQVGETVDSLDSGRDLIWDTGKVISERCVHIEYAGPEVGTGKRYYWRVKAWDKGGNDTGWSEKASWEMGMLHSSDWSAKWVDPESEIDPLAFKPCPFLRKSFNLNTKPRLARAYITAHGVYELSINGIVVGDHVLPPGFTSYHERLQYQVHDVTGLLSAGENVIGVILGDGWYRGKTDALSFRNVYGDRLALLFEMHIKDQGNQESIIISDEGWMTITGPILKSDLKDGETYDARKEMKGWNEPGYDDSLWHPVKVVDYGYENLVALNSPSIMRKEEFSPKILHTPNGELVLDLGQNIAGRLRMKIKGPAGTAIRLYHGEALDNEGNFTMKNLHVPGYLRKIFNVDNVQQTDTYILKGDDWEFYEPKFTYHGFRFVKVEGFPGEPTQENFTGIAIYSDMRETGTFDCSNPLVNRLHENIKWTLKSNFVDIPTDCPQRERSGWLGDAQVFSQTSSILMETAGFYAKWFKDFSVDQRPDGKMPGVVPDPSRQVDAGIIGMTNGSAGFSDAAVIIPWNVYQAFDDTRVLENQYQSMKAWVDYIVFHAKKIHWTKKLQPRFWFKVPDHYNFVWDSDYHWGEWQEPDKNQFLQILLNFLFSQPEVATAYFSHSSLLLSKISEILGKRDESSRYLEISIKAKEAWQKEFVGRNGRLKPDRQATYVRALAFDLLPDEIRPQAAKRLAELIKNASYHIGTGFLSTTYINRILTDYRYEDIAYKLLLQVTRPSWLYPVTKGATTVWEFWDVIKEDGTIKLGSMSHYSPGSVGSWLYQYVAGIRLNPSFPGYSRFTIHPVFGGDLTYARANFISQYGKITSEWKKQNDTITMAVSVPVNSIADVVLPGAKIGNVREHDQPINESTVFESITEQGNDVKLSIGSGEYVFVYQQVS